MYPEAPNCQLQTSSDDVRSENHWDLSPSRAILDLQVTHIMFSGLPIHLARFVTSSTVLSIILRMTKVDAFFVSFQPYKRDHLLRSTIWFHFQTYGTQTLFPACFQFCVQTLVYTHSKSYPLSFPLAFFPCCLVKPFMHYL